MEYEKAFYSSVCFAATSPILGQELKCLNNNSQLSIEKRGRPDLRAASQVET